jgi:hypothetical protein
MRPPTRRAALAVGVALLLVTAGCSGGQTPRSTTTTTNGTPTTTTTTPTTTTTTPTTTTTTPTTTWSPNASVDQYPPGVADNGTLTNASTLVDAHFAATANESTKFTSAWTRNNDSSVRTYAHGENPTPYSTAFHRTEGDLRVKEAFYSTGSHSYSRVTFDNQTLYRTFQNTTDGVQAWTRDSTFGPRSSLRMQLTSGNYSVNGTVERGGRTYVQLTADEVSAARSDSLATYEGAVLVTPEGVVYDVDSSYSRESNGETIQTDVSLTLDTDVQWSGAPSWVADVPHLSLSTVEGGHAIEIRNTGGAALPANATFRIAATNETTWAAPTTGDASGTVTTTERLEPGEAVYVTVGADGSASSFALHRAVTRGEFTFRTVSLRGRVGNVVYRLVTGTEAARDESVSTNRSDVTA